MRLFIFLVSCTLAFTECNNKESQDMDNNLNTKISCKDSSYSKLTSDEYHVCHDKGTEPPYSGKYANHWKKGIYYCVVCNESLFSSETKYQSGTGWPSFNNQIGDHVIMISDTSHGMLRQEILCKKCGSHLGHVFEDGPKPTGLRYCVNSLALNFHPAK